MDLDAGTVAFVNTLNVEFVDVFPVAVYKPLYIPDSNATIKMKLSYVPLGLVRVEKYHVRLREQWEYSLTESEIQAIIDEHDAEMGELM